MEVHEYFSALKADVLTARVFGQQEHKKRNNRFKTVEVVNEAPQSLSLNDYIEMFQIIGSSDAYSGDVSIFTQFEQEWQQALQNIQHKSADIEMAIDIMQEDVHDIVQALKALHVEDEAFHDRMKKQLIKLIQHVVVSIRDGWSANPHVYEQLLQPIQQLLSDVGVYTVNVSLGDALNYDITEPQQSTENVTDDEALIDTVKEVQLYPYMYGNDDKPFLVGRVIAWRKG